MPDFTVTLANGWTLRARVERMTHAANVSPRERVMRRTSMELRFAIWDDETKSGVTIEATAAQVLLGMHALGNVQRRDGGAAVAFEVENDAPPTEATAGQS